MSKITIAQFAQARGITAAAVYKRLKTVYKPYVTVENGQKMLDAAILSAFPPAGGYAAGNKPGFQSENTVDESIRALREALEALREQLAAKDRQIEALTAALSAAQQSIQAEQAIRAGSIKRLPFWKRRKEDETV